MHPRIRIAHISEYAQRRSGVIESGKVGSDVSYKFCYCKLRNIFPGVRFQLTSLVVFICDQLYIYRLDDRTRGST